MRRFSPRDITMYLLLAVLLFFTFSALQQMDRGDAPIYSDIRTLFVQEKVSYFELKDNTLTLVLRGEDGTSSTLAYHVADPDWLYQDLHELWESQQNAGLLRYDLPQGIEGSWWYNLLPYLVAAAVLAFFWYLMMRQRAGAAGGSGVLLRYILPG